MQKWKVCLPDDSVVEDDLTLEEAERVLCRQCNLWDWEEDEEGPYLTEDE